MTKKQLERLEKKLDVAQYNYNKAFQIFQRDCSHNCVVQIEKDSRSYILPDVPPFRLCMDCGLAEEESSCRYEILKETTGLIMPRDQAYKLRKRMITASWKDNNRNEDFFPLANEQ